MVTEWFRSKHLLNRGEIVTIIVSTGPTTPVVISPDEENHNDVLALERVLVRMSSNRLRMEQALYNMNITCLSQVVARSSDKYWRQRNLGKVSLRAFAEALKAEGVDCFVTNTYLGPDKPLRVPDLRVCKLRPIKNDDWENMIRVASVYTIPIIEFMRKNHNKPVPFSEAFKSSWNVGISYPTMAVSGFNTSFRNKNLPYRMKISEAINGKRDEDRTVQILTMSHEKS